MGFTQPVYNMNGLTAFEVNKRWRKIPISRYSSAYRIDVNPKSEQFNSSAVVSLWKTIFHKRNRERLSSLVWRGFIFPPSATFTMNMTHCWQAETVWSAVCLTCRPAETSSNLKSGRFSHQPGAKTHLQELTTTSTCATAPVSP